MDSGFKPGILCSGVWQPRDESENFSQKHDVELIKEEKRLEVEAEIRLNVDELMRQELKNLKMVCFGFNSLLNQHAKWEYIFLCIQ